MFETLKRTATLATGKIYTLPIVFLEPHGACNCRCVMCDIWKGNKTAPRWTREDLQPIQESLKRLETRRVCLTGGEALMHPDFFEFCRAIRGAGPKITLLSTGLLLASKAEELTRAVDEVILSLDGPEDVHVAIRRVPQAFAKLRQGVRALKDESARFPVSARCVVQKDNFRSWTETVRAARDIGLDRISFLPADPYSEAFNRPAGWTQERIDEVVPAEAELPALEAELTRLLHEEKGSIAAGFVVEKPKKLARIVHYYAACRGKADFPPVRCNAPWVSAVVEADGTVRPCFFHKPYGALGKNGLDSVLNHAPALSFRRRLQPASNARCKTCVCSLNLPPIRRV